MKRKIAAAVAAIMAVSAMTVSVTAAPPAGSTQEWASNFATDISGWNPYASGLGGVGMANDILTTRESYGGRDFIQITAGPVGGPRNAPLVFDTPIAAPQVYVTFEVNLNNAESENSLAEVVIRDSQDLLDWHAEQAALLFMANSGDHARSYGSIATLGMNIFRVIQSNDQVFFGATSFATPYINELAIGRGADTSVKDAMELERIEGHSNRISVNDVYAPGMANSWIRVSALMDFEARTISATLTNIETGATVSEVLAMADHHTDEIGSMSMSLGRQGGGNAGGTVQLANIAFYTAAAGAAQPPAPTAPPTATQAPAATQAPTDANQPVATPTPSVPTGNNMTIAFVVVIGALLVTAFVVRKKVTA